MGTVTVRKLADDVMRDLRRSAAERGVSMEQEARDRLRQPLPEKTSLAPPAESKWRLKATLEELMALGDKPRQPIDHKAESDALYDYLDKK